MYILYNPQSKYYEAYFQGKLMIRNENVKNIKAAIVLKHYALGEKIDLREVLKYAVIH